MQARSISATVRRPTIDTLLTLQVHFSCVECNRRKQKVRSLYRWHPALPAAPAPDLSSCRADPTRLAPLNPALPAIASLVADRCRNVPSVIAKLLVRTVSPVRCRISVGRSSMASRIQISKSRPSARRADLPVPCTLFSALLSGRPAAVNAPALTRASVMSLSCSYEQDVRSRLDRIEDLLKDLRDASAAHSHHSHAAIGGSSSSSAHPGAPHYLPPININGRSSSAVPSSVSPRPASIQPLRLSFSGSNASDGGRGGSGNGGEGEDDDDEDGQMGTMSGGRFYGPSAMSSVSSSRMNKILQDVRARPLQLLLRAFLSTYTDRSFAPCALSFPQRR